MGRITAVQQKNNDEYAVYIDDQLFMTVHEDVLVSCQLLKGTNVDETELEEIIEVAERKKGERIGLRLLQYRDRTRHEMVERLRAKGVRSSHIEQLLDEWEKQGYIDDRRFAKQWIQYRLLRKQKGPALLAVELRQKGIDDSLIAEVLEEIDADMERNSCLQAAQKKIGSQSLVNDRHQKTRLYRFLRQRGFRHETIITVFQQME